MDFGAAFSHGTAAQRLDWVAGAPRSVATPAGRIDARLRRTAAQRALRVDRSSCRRDHQDHAGLEVRDAGGARPYPTVVLLSKSLAPALDRLGIDKSLAMFVGNVISVGLLQWILV